LIKLFGASSKFGNIRREGETTIHWLASRKEPVAPYKDLILKYGDFNAHSQELAVNQRFTMHEIEELGVYLKSTKGFSTGQNSLNDVVASRRWFFGGVAISKLLANAVKREITSPKTGSQ
jgi:hypothetical protein